jgi:thiol-disulfide isomerase/thioredoxin
MKMLRSVLMLCTAFALILGGCVLMAYHVARAKSRVVSAPKAAGGARQASVSTPQDSANAQAVELKFAKDPEVAPPFQTRDLAGAAVSTAALKGKVVIINFWATWCGPCREEIPELVALQARYKDDLQIVGVSEDDGPPEQVAKFAQKQGINYPVIMSSDALEKEYGGVTALPTSFLVNKDGRVVQKDVGLYPPEYYDLQVRALMGLPLPANTHIETFQDTGQIFLKNVDRASELPGVSFAGLTDAQKKEALHKLNAQNCTCGCQMTLAQCRISDPSCDVSDAMAAKVVHGITHPGAATATSSKPGADR